MKNRIEMLDLSKQEPTSEKFLNYWHEHKYCLRNQEISIAEFYHLKVQRQLKHMLVTLSGGDKMEVIIYGCGKPILFISGLGITAPIWINQIDELSINYQIIIVHMPGHGLSESTVNLTYFGICSVLHELISFLFGMEKVAIVATCIGGSIAINFTALFPECVSKLILVGAILEWDTKIFSDLTRGRKWVKEVISYLDIFSTKLAADFNTYIQKKERKYLLKYEPFDLSNLHENSKCMDPFTYVSYFLSLSKDNDLRAQVRKIAVPTLLIAGEEDSVVDINNTRIIHEMVSGSNYFKISNTGHFPYVTHDSLFNQKVKQFLQ
jgi:pimeloyl-ACP methyl ester carboxylesterase